MSYLKQNTSVLKPLPVIKTVELAPETISPVYFLFSSRYPKLFPVVFLGASSLAFLFSLLSSSPGRGLATASLYCGYVQLKLDGVVQRNHGNRTLCCVYVMAEYHCCWCFYGILYTFSIRGTQKPRYSPQVELTGKAIVTLRYLIRTLTTGIQ